MFVSKETAFKVSAAVVAARGMYWLFYQTDPSQHCEADLAKKRDKKLRERQEKRQEFEQFLKENPELVPAKHVQEEIAKASAMELVDWMKTKKHSCVTVMITMCIRAKLCGEKLESNASEMFMLAIERSRISDQLLKEKPEECQAKMLFGLPVSIKENLRIKNTDTTAGLASRLFEPAETDACVVASLIKAGAIPFVKSNIPQGLMLPESVSFYGRSKNPWSLLRSPGGSSGGEGCLVGSYCSPLGIGTDIGGSIRIPASFTGICGFKPTPERMTRQGTTSGYERGSSGQNSILGVPGPMARTVEDLEVAMQVLWGGDTATYLEDNFVPPLPFRKIAKRPRRIGYFSQDGWFGTAQGNERAVLEAKRVLEEQGHTLVPFTVPNPEKIVALFYGILSSDGGLKSMKAGLNGESLIEEYAEISATSQIPGFLRGPLGVLLESFGEGRKANILRHAAQKTVFEYWNTVRELAEYKQMFVEEMKKHDIEALLSPTVAVPAFTHSASKDLCVALIFTFMYNVLHFPAGTVPMTLTKPDECHMVGGTRDSWGKQAEDLLKDAAGLPIGVQIATLPWQDELCLSLLKEIQVNAPLKEAAKLAYLY